MLWQQINKFTLTLALVLGLSVPAWAQFTLVGQDYEECNTSAATCTFGTGVSAASGDLVVVLISNRDVIDVSSIADGTNTGYTCPDGLDQTNGSVRGMACYFIGSASGTVTPVITWASNSRAHANFQVWRPTGTVTLDATVEGDNASGTAHVSPSLSTSANAALVVCGFAFQGGAGAMTAGTGYTLLDDLDARWGGQYDITSVASGSFTCDLTSTNSFASAAVAASFNDSGAGGGAGPCLMGLLGVGKCD